MKSFFQCKVLLIFLVIPMQILAATSASDQLIELLSQLKSMRANFVQTVMNNGGKVLQKNSGKLILQRPGHFRWQVEQPNKQLLIADGQNIWFYDIDLRQIMVQKQKMAIADSPAALLSGDPSDLMQHFTVAFLQGGHGFYLLPKDKNALFHSIILIFKQNRLYEMRLSDKLGQQAVIHFSQIDLSSTIGSENFHFVLPKDKNVEIVKG